METKKDIVGGKGRLTLTGDSLLQALVLKQRKESKAGRVVSLVETIRELVAEKYLELMQEEVQKNEKLE